MKRSALLFLTLALPAFGWAQSGPLPLSLQDATRYALTHSDSIKNARLNIPLQEARNKQVTANALPRITTEGSFNAYIDQMQTFIPGDFFGQPGAFVPVNFVPKYSTAASGTASQLLFDGSVLVALQARNTIMELVRQGVKLTEEELRYNVQRSYFSVVIAQKQFDILKASIGIARDALHDVSVLYESGYAEKIDLDRSKVQVNNLATDSLRTASLIIAAQQLLKYQIGMDINQPIVLTDTGLDQFTANAQLLADEITDYGSRTEWGLLQTQLKLNEYDLKRYRLAALPTLSAFYNAGYNYAADEFRHLFGRQYLWSSMVGVKLSVPIFQGFLRTNQVREAKINIERTQNNISLLEKTIDFQTAQSRTVLQNSLRALESQQRNVELALSVVDLARKKYKAGVGSNQEVTQAQGELLRAQGSYFQSLLDVVNASSDLQRALGQFK